MININYDRTTNTTLVETKNLRVISEFLPLRVEFKNILTDEIHYEASLGENWWVEWCGGELITDVLIYDNQDNLLQKWKWDVELHGDIIEKTLWFYLKNRLNMGLTSKGLVIGTHDGRNGHWVYPIKNNLSNVTLVEGSEKQYRELVKNWGKNNNTETLNKVITTNGLDVEWFQGGEGYTDTILPGFIDEWVGKENVIKTHRKSTSIKDLINGENYDWVHLDVEGIDSDLIIALPIKPNIIIFEDMNLLKEQKVDVDLWFRENGYKLTGYNGNSIAIAVR